MFKLKKSEMVFPLYFRGDDWRRTYRYIIINGTRIKRDKQQKYNFSIQVAVTNSSVYALWVYTIQYTLPFPKISTALVQRKCWFI